MTKPMAGLAAKHLRTMVAARDDLLAETAVELEQAQAENVRLQAQLDIERLALKHACEVLEQTEARVKQLEEALSDAADALIDIHRRSHAQEAAQDTLAGYKSVKTTFAEGDAGDDGRLKPEAVRRLQESSKRPRRDLLTADQMRQKLAEEGGAETMPISPHQIEDHSAYKQHEDFICEGCGYCLCKEGVHALWCNNYPHNLGDADADPD